MLTIGHNQGLGDCLLMNGAVRYLASKHGNIRYLAVSKNVQTLQHMYRNDDNINVINLGAKGKVTSIYRKHIKSLRRSKQSNLIFNWGIMANWSSDMRRIGLDPLKNSWCEAFYKLLGVSYNHRYDSWGFDRDLNAEDNVFDIIGIPRQTDYCFVVDGRMAGVRMARTELNIETDRIIVNPHNFNWRKTNILDWIGVIKHASEIHVIDTSWFHLVKQMRTTCPKFLHDIRKVPATPPRYLNDEWDNGWEVINY